MQSKQYTQYTLSSLRWVLINFEKAPIRHINKHFEKYFPQTLLYLSLIETKTKLLIELQVSVLRKSMWLILNFYQYQEI